jgi:hypothetical protein
MSIFKSEQLIENTVPDIAPAARELVCHFQERGFEVAGSQTEQGGWEISIGPRAEDRPRD